MRNLEASRHFEHGELTALTGSRGRAADQQQVLQIGVG
jgi:hypothetical protein